MVRTTGINSIIRGVINTVRVCVYTRTVRSQIPVGYCPALEQWGTPLEVGARSNTKRNLSGNVRIVWLLI